MTRRSILDHFEKVELPDPVDLVINQIRDLIHTGILKPGDRLPSEKRIAPFGHRGLKYLIEQEYPCLHFSPSLLLQMRMKGTCTTIAAANTPAQKMLTASME